MKTRILGTLVLPLLFLGCLEGSTGPALESAPEIRVRVSGGLAGVDYTILVDGTQGEVIGEACVSGCDFEAGQTLHGLTTDQATYLADLFLEADIHGLDGTNFGVECCDQFHYDATYLDASGLSQVMGSSEALPEALRKAMEAVAGFARDLLPIVVDMGADPDLWPKDPFTPNDFRIEGDVLRMGASFGGGCATHHFNLVAHGGWMESDPAQIKAFLSHDGQKDTCEAFLSRELAYDLTPLKKAYQAAYGETTPGTTTLLVMVDLGPTYFSTQYWPGVYIF